MKFYILLISLFLAACSTTPITSDTGKTIPKERIFLKNNIETSQKSSVTFLRDSGITGYACTFVLYANNQKVAAIQSGEKITLYLLPGFYIFRLESTTALCPGSVISTELDLKDGKNAEYRITIDSNMTLRIVRNI